MLQLRTAIASILGGAVAASVGAPLASAATIHVPGDAPSLSAAIAIATDGDTILVADGTWKGPANRDLEISGKDLVVRSEHGPAQCVLDCEHKARAFYLDSCGSDTLIEGFTIRHGQAGDGVGTWGQGAYVEAGAPVVRGCVFDACGLIYSSGDGYGPYGGGLALSNSAAVVEDCSFTANLGEYGGAVYSQGGSPTLRRCVFRNNKGEAHIYPGFFGPFWEGSGGAIRIFDGDDVEISDCLFDGNESVARAGAIGVEQGFQQPCTGRIAHCTFVNNSAFSDSVNLAGEVIAIESSGTPGLLWTLDHGIVWANKVSVSALDGAAINFHVSDSDVQGGHAGDGNLDVDPLFLDLAADDLRLSAHSPCVDVGPPDALPRGGFSDLDHASRLLDGNLDGTLALDMGAYEHSNVALAVGGVADPGGSVTLDVSGTPGLRYVVAVGAPLAGAPALLGDFGYALVQLGLPWRVVAGPGQIPASTTLTIPSSTPPGSVLVLQPVAWAGTHVVGNFGAPVTLVVN